MKKHLLSFIAGFLSTLTFHQGTAYLLYLAGILPMISYNISPTLPLGVPAVLSLSFFGGLWGVLLAMMIRPTPQKQYWIKWILFGAIGPTLVAYVVVFPMKGIPINLAMLPFGLLLNGLWGLGTGLFIRLFSQRKIAGRF